MNATMDAQYIKLNSSLSKYLLNANPNFRHGFLAQIKQN